MNSATVMLMTTVITIIIFQRLPKGTHYFFFFKLNHRWPCSKFDHGQCGVTFQYRDLYNRGKKITSFRLRTSRKLTCVSPSFFIPVNLKRSFQELKMIYFVHNYFHLVIFHRLFDHLVQWITLDITKRRQYSEHILPVPWLFLIWRFHCNPFRNFVIMIKAC